MGRCCSGWHICGPHESSVCAPHGAATAGPGRWLVYTDGACADRTDALVARAAWGLHVPAQRGVMERGRAVPVQGAQTARRGELTAVVPACRLLPGGLAVVSDSRYVVDGVTKIAAGSCCREWRHADIWLLLWPRGRDGDLTARWVPAHKQAEEYAELGYTE